MKLGQRPTTALLIAAYIAAGVSMGCAARVAYGLTILPMATITLGTISERGYYNQWVVETTGQIGTIANWTQTIRRHTGNGVTRITPTR